MIFSGSGIVLCPLSIVHCLLSIVMNLRGELEFADILFGSGNGSYDNRQNARISHKQYKKGKNQVSMEKLSMDVSWTSQSIQSTGPIVTPNWLILAKNTEEPSVATKQARPARNSCHLLTPSIREHCNSSILKFKNCCQTLSRIGRSNLFQLVWRGTQTNKTNN